MVADSMSMATARESERRWAYWVYQFPVAIVCRDHRAGAHPFFEIGAAVAADQFGGAGQRDLDFGDGRDGHFWREHVVEHMVVAQVGVGEDIVPDSLGIAQAAAVADHQPCFWPEDGEVVADGFRVGRAHADVDQGDAQPILGDQVVAVSDRRARALSVGASR